MRFRLHREFSNVRRTRRDDRAYKKAPPGTTVEVADGDILHGGEFGCQINLDKPSNVTNVVMIGDVSHVPGPYRNRLPTLKAVEQMEKSFI